MNARIKSTVGSSDMAYPCLMKAKASELIVLFMTDNHGIVVHPNDRWRIGDYETDWAFNTFDHFTGELVLSN
jgi:hypothetical protein